MMIITCYCYYLKLLPNFSFFLSQAQMEELLTDPTNQFLSFDTTGSIAWSTDDVFAKVMGKERKCCIRGVGFGPNPSGRSRSALTDLHIQSSQSRDNEVAQLKEELSTMKEN